MEGEVIYKKNLKVEIPGESGMAFPGVDKLWNIPVV